MLNRATTLLLFLLQFCTGAILIYTDEYLGRIFEGIGAISGGGATSKLLPVYKEPYINEILDYLFKPGFGASLNALKVEIGGDSQSTEGTEASHMHTSDDLDCTRGYETWLVQKALKINPNLQIHSLPWTFPGWLGSNPYQDSNRTAKYITQWITCMDKVAQVRVDSVGIWNERAYDVHYIKTLRRTLNEAGYESVKIIASDDHWQIASDLDSDKELDNAIYAIGAHYPGTRSSAEAQNSGKPLWSSEDHSTRNNDVGSGCWARILNQNYVNGLMTSTIAWNLVAAYSDKLPYPRCALMTANEPWSGHYAVEGSVWITAHTTHFVDPGWSYLGHGSGVGHLPQGGSYVTLVSPDKEHLTIVVETLSYNHSKCIRPPLPQYGVASQNVTFQIIGSSFGKLTKLHVFRSRLRFGQNKTSEYFIYLGEFSVKRGTITLELGIDEVYTLSTRNSTKGSHPKPPKSRKFHLPYSDDFQVGRSEVREAQYLTPQAGYFELVPDDNTWSHERRTVLQQMALQKPIDWCNVGANPIALMGYEKGWKNIHVQSTVLLPSVQQAQALFIAGRISNGGCEVRHSKGIFAWLNFKEQQYEVTQDLAGVKLLASGSLDLVYDKWYLVELILKENKAQFYVDHRLLTTLIDAPVKEDGFVGLGCGGFGRARYANFTLTST